METQMIWACDEERDRLWTIEPRRAAMLAYLEIVALWHDQVEQGVYLGVPALHRLPGARTTDDAGAVDPSTQRSRPARYTRDDSAGQWMVPGRIRDRWLAAVA